MIGEHSVTLIPDPDVQAWGPVLASNAYFNGDLVGWAPAAFQTPWTWAAGWAVGPVGQSSSSLGRSRNYPVLRDASIAYRIRAIVKVDRPGWVVPLIHYGRTPEAAEIGPFYVGSNNATSQEQWVNLATAGTHTLEATFNPAGINPEFLYLGPRVTFLSGQSAQIDSLEFQGQGGVSVDLTCLVDQVSINHGRTDTDSQPEASSATVDLSLITGQEALPDSLEVGGILRVETRTAAIDSTRFVGRITDIAYGWEEAGDSTPNRVQAQVIAVALLADLGRRIVGDVPWPQELDGARVSRIMAAAGVTLDPTFSDPGTVQVIPRDVDSQAALEVAQSTAGSGQGVVWHTRTGDVRYADANHRRGATPALELDSCDLLVTPVWRRTTEGLLNRVSLGYGVPPEEGEQPRYLADAPTSVERYGRYELSTETELATLADATALGQLLLNRNSSPVWVMSELPVAMKDLDASQTTALLAADMHTLLRLTGLPVAGAAPTSALLWVEGWQETLTWGDHELTLCVSGYCRTTPAPQWDDLDAAWTWDEIGGVDTRSAPARRFYLTYGGTPGASPAYGSTWEQTPTGTGRYPLLTAASNLPLALVQMVPPAVTPPVDSLWRQYVSDPMPAKTMDGSFQLVIGALTAGISLDVFLNLRVAVVSGDGATERGVCYAGNSATVVSADPASPAYEFAVSTAIVSGARTRILSGTLTPVAVQNGDRLVVEVGARSLAPNGSTRTANLVFGDPTSGSDLTYAVDLAGDSGRPWIEFSNDPLSPDTTPPVSTGPTWDEMNCVGPLPDRGYWDDAPASTRWNQVPHTTTWDNY